MENRKIPFFKRVKLAIFNLERYQDFATEKLSVAIKYFLKLMFVFTAIIAIAITYQYTQITSNAINSFKNEIPDFKLENNVLTVQSETPTIVESNSNTLQYVIVIDTNSDENSEKFKEYSKRVDLYNLGAILLKDKVIIKTGLVNGFTTMTYEQLSEQYNLEKFDKQTALDIIDGINPVSMTIALYLTLIIYLFISYVIAVLIETIILFILGYLISRIARVRMKNAQIYTIGLYSLTLPILLNALYIVVNILTGFEIKYFQMMYSAISYIYLITAILLIRTELIKQQIEVKKIEEVQEDIKKEIEERQEEEKKETEDKKEKEDKDNDKDVGTDGQAPEGTT